MWNGGAGAELSEVAWDVAAPTGKGQAQCRQHVDHHGGLVPTHLAREEGAAARHTQVAATPPSPSLGLYAQLSSYKVMSLSLPDWEVPAQQDYTV